MPGKNPGFLWAYRSDCNGCPGRLQCGNGGTGAAAYDTSGRNRLRDAIAWVNEQMACTVGRRYKYTFSGSVLFERMKRQGRYTTDTSVIRERVRRAGAENVFAMQPQL